LSDEQLSVFGQRPVVGHWDAGESLEDGEATIEDGIHVDYDRVVTGNDLLVDYGFPN
jgi:hypothetical protein